MSIQKNIILLALGALALGITGVSATVMQITASIETRSHFDDAAGFESDADDPAIWVNGDDEDESIVAVTLKDGGIDVYDLGGKLLQHIPVTQAPHPEDQGGRINNIDIVYGFEFEGDEVDLMVASNRGFDRLDIYMIDEDAVEDGEPPLIDVGDKSLPFLFAANQAEVNDGLAAYGMAAAKMGDDDDDPTYVFVTRNDRVDITHVELFDNGEGQITYTPIGHYRAQDEYILPDGEVWVPCKDEEGKEAHMEGTVIDRAHGVVYFAQEAVGILKADINDVQNTLELLDTVASFGADYILVPDDDPGEFDCEYLAGTSNFPGQHLEADVEGLTLYEMEDGEGYLLASSQGDNTIAVYDRVNNDYLGSFTVGDGNKTDGVEGTDGMAVSNADFGGKFKKGLLVLQDGTNNPQEFNCEGEERGDNSNFKYVKWKKIADALNLDIDNDFDIRDID